MAATPRESDCRGAGVQLPEGASFLPLLTQSLDGFSVTDRDGYLVYCSPSMTNLLGFATDQLERKRNVDFVHFEDRAKMLNLMSRATDSSNEMVRMRLLCSNGTYLPVESKACSDGTFIYCVMRAGPRLG